MIGMPYQPEVKCTVGKTVLYYDGYIMVVYPKRWPNAKKREVVSAARLPRVCTVDPIIHTDSAEEKGLRP